jgi:hypothetical protein
MPEVRTNETNNVEPNSTNAHTSVVAVDTPGCGYAANLGAILRMVDASFETSAGELLAADGAVMGCFEVNDSFSWSSV